ncbi:uncharacterized protein METZ01_LOCUS111889, partial [marine metagenome]
MSQQKDLSFPWKENLNKGISAYTRSLSAILANHDDF